MTDSSGPPGRRYPILPDRPSDSLLQRGLVILSGGADTLGLPLIVFPAKHHSALQTIKVSDLCQLVKYYISITKPGLRLNGFAFLVDLKVSNVQSFNVIVETLETLQKENQGCVAVFYCLQPRGKEACKFLKKLLGLKEKKKRMRWPFKKSQYKLDSQRGTNSCIFKSVLMADLGELFRYIERRQLTSEFGGSLMYNHESWIQFRKAVESTAQDVDHILENIPSTQDKIEMLKEYDLPETEEELGQLKGWIENRYHDVMKELNIEQVIDECKDIIEKCRNPDTHAAYSDLQHNPMLEDTAATLEKHHTRLVKSRNQFKSAWQDAERRLMKASNARLYKEKTSRILKWIDEVGMPAFDEPVEVAVNLSQAETLKNHFEAGFYTLGKEILVDADEMTESMEKLSLEGHSHIPDMEFFRVFKIKVSEFRQALERRFRKYVDVYHFYLLSGKVTRWYRRTVMFLPVKYLCPLFDYGQDEEIQLTEEWNAEVNKYLYKHPAPRPEHIQKLQEGIPLVTNMRNRNQARLLVHRVQLLRKLLVEGKIVAVEYRQLVKLKEKVSHGLDDLDNDHSRSLPDLTRIAKNDQPKPRGSATLTRLPVSGFSEPVSRAKSYNSLLAPRRSSDLSNLDLTTDEGMPRPRPRLGLSATMDRYQKSNDYMSEPENNLRRFRSQPTVNIPSASRDSAGRKGVTPQKHGHSKHTPGRRFVKARDQRTHRNRSNSNAGEDSDTTELSYPTNRRTFSFHRNPVNRNDYGIFGESDTCDDSVFSSHSNSSTLPLRDSRERYISLNYPMEPLSLPCSPPPDFFGGDRLSSSQSNFTSRSNQTLPSSFRVKEDSYDSGIGHAYETHTALGSKINPLYSSLPNLLAQDLKLTPQNVRPQSSLSMTQDNLDRISRSDLLPGEKLDLMSAMLENEPVRTPTPRRQRSVDIVKLPNAHVTNNLRLTPDEQVMVQEILDRQREEKRKQQQYYREEIARRQSQGRSPVSPRLEVYSPCQDQVDNDQDSSDEESESEDDSNAGASTDEDVRRLNEAIKVRRQEELRLAQNRQKLQQIDEQATTPTSHETTLLGAEILLQSPAQEDDPLKFTLQRLQGTSPRYKQENGISGQTDSDYSGSDANSSTRGSRVMIENSYRRRGFDSSHVSVKEWVQRYDRRVHASDSGYTGAASYTDRNASDLADSLSDNSHDVLADLKGIETLENSLQKHSMLEQRAMIERSRDRMLRDLSELSVPEKGQSSQLTDGVFY